MEHESFLNYLDREIAACNTPELQTAKMALTCVKQKFLAVREDFRFGLDEALEDRAKILRKRSEQGSTADGLLEAREYVRDAVIKYL